MKNTTLLKKLLAACLLTLFVGMSHTAQSQISLWTWVSGDSTNSPAVYGIKGVASLSNRPGSFGSSCLNFSDTLGNLYLFGTTYDGPNLWRYNPSTNEWTWLHGDTTLPHHYTGVFGTQGFPNPANTPGELQNAATWDDANNSNLWLFGGYDGRGVLNDLWNYDLATNQWTWVKGDNTPDMHGVYGIKGVTSLSNKPGGRVFPITWRDITGNLWLMGGSGIAASGATSNSYLNDVWKYETATSKWAWMAGDSSANMPVVYGTLGVALPANNPGRFSKSVSWNDPSGNIWVLSDVYKVGFVNPSNALWKFNTSSLLWTWMGGDTTGNGVGKYGQQGIASPTNMPPGRSMPYCWTDSANNLWLFGGTAYALQQNDLWKYNTTTHEWVWLDGKPSIFSSQWLPAYFGKKGFPYMLNHPGSRQRGASWKDKAGNFWLYGGTFSSSPIQQGVGCDLWKLKPADYNILKFTTFIDANYNGIHEASEPYLKSTRATITATSTAFSLTSSLGQFFAYVDTGTYKTAPVLSAPYYTVVPANRTTTHSSYFNLDSFDFALQPIPGYKDLTINVFPASALQHRHMIYRIDCQNIGTDTANGSYRFVKDSRLTFDSVSQTGATFTGDTVTWHFNNLSPLQTTGSYIYMTIMVPPIVDGDTVHCSARAYPLAGETSLIDNDGSVEQIILGSYDPNDKTENHGGKIAFSKVMAGEYLTYTIRFQNTGHAPAYDVYIQDTLDSKADWNSMQMLTASHNYNMEMNNGKCKWTFANINLLDSNHNEPKSHGYIVYKIKLKPTVQLGDVIKNKAAIYFDYNLPIFTNTEMTTVVAETFPLKLLSFTAKKEGKTNLLKWATAQEINVDRFEVERSYDGREFAKIGSIKATGANKYSYTDNNPTRNEKQEMVFYRLKMIDKDGQFTYSTIRQLNINNSSLNITIYPNPAKDVLQVEIYSDKKTNLQLQVLSQDGKVILSNSMTAAEGSLLRSVNITALQSGTYFLRVTSGENEQTVVKFEKL